MIVYSPKLEMIIILHRYNITFRADIIETTSF